MALPAFVEPFVEPEAQSLAATRLGGPSAPSALRQTGVGGGDSGRVVARRRARRRGAGTGIGHGGDPWRGRHRIHHRARDWVEQPAHRGRRCHAATQTVELPRLPVFLRFDRRRVVVVGGGTVAASKIPALVAAGGAVTVVAPSVSPAIDRSRVTVIEREFRPDDLDGAWFVTAAATPAVNRQVRDAAESRKRVRERRG